MSWWWQPRGKCSVVYLKALCTCFLISIICVQIYDNYADSNGTYWHLCEIHIHSDDESEVPQLQNVQLPNLNSMNIANTDSQTQLPQWMMPSPVHITSYLNTLHVRQITEIGSAAVQLNATIRVQPGAVLFRFRNVRL